MQTMTENQWQEIQETGELRLLDPGTQSEYVAVRVELFSRLKRILEMEDYDPDEGMSHMIDTLFDDDAGDPLLESYQCYLTVI